MLFSPYLRTKYSPAKRLLLGSLPYDELFLRRILSNTFTAHLSTLPDSSESSTSKTRKREVDRSFTVSYLIDSCGLSPEAADASSEKVHFATPEKPDSVLSLLRNHGFTKTQVAILVRQYPIILLADAEKTLLPKFSFYQSIGFLQTKLAKTITHSPNFLRSSLKNQIIPIYNFLKTVIQSDQKVCDALQRFPRHAIGEPCTKTLVPNTALLRKLQVPESSIALLLTHFPRVIARRPEDFSEAVRTVKEMGFSPSKTAFIEAVRVLTGKSNAIIRDRCHKAYTEWGWSNDDILLAFKKQPNCMLMSEKKITKTMELLVNEMGWPSKDIARYPRVLLSSLEKCIIPRCSVIRLLVSKGLLKNKYAASTILIGGERRFVKTFVTKYEKQVPELLSFYQAKKKLSGGDALKL